MIKEIKSRIENLNPNFDRNASVYYVSFPNLIGYSNNETTNSVKVITALGTKKIITMYPAILSSEYNSEGLQESKELSLKRGLKWKN